MKLSNDVKRVLLDAMDSLDISYRSYSGRAMYGRQCLGVSFDRDESPVLEFDKFVVMPYDPDSQDRRFTFNQVENGYRRAS